MPRQKKKIYSKKPPNVAKSNGKSKRGEEILTVVAPFSSSYFATHSSLDGATLPPDFSKRLTWESEKLIPVQYFFRSDLQRQSIRIKTLSRAIFLLHKFNNGFFIPYTIGVSWASEIKESLVMLIRELVKEQSVIEGITDLWARR